MTNVRAFDLSEYFILRRVAGAAEIVHGAKGRTMPTKERLAAMAASHCGVCSGAMAGKLVAADPNNPALELRTYECSECGHSCTYSVDAGPVDGTVLA